MGWPFTFLALISERFGRLGLTGARTALGEEGMWPVMSERAAISMTAAWLSTAAAVTYQILLIALIFISAGPGSLMVHDK